MPEDLINLINTINTDESGVIVTGQYLARFTDLPDYEDEYEMRLGSVVSGIHFNTPEEMQVYLDEGYRPITVEEQEALADGGVRRKSDGAIVPRPPIKYPLSVKIDRLIKLIDEYTATQITSGFEFTVTSSPVTGTGKFDSTKEDQMTFSTMYAASKSPDFPDHPVYHGRIPMRGYPKIGDNNYGDKIIYYLDAENMQAFDALALHIGSCKQNGWRLQNIAKSATEDTFDNIESEIYNKIGYTPEER